MSRRDIRQDDNSRRYVYVVQGVVTGLVKIGHSANVTQRLGALRMASPDELRLLKVLGPIRQAHRIELAFHEAFRDRLTHGEWFTPDAALLDTVEEWSGIVPTNGRARYRRMRAEDDKDRVQSCRRSRSRVTVVDHNCIDHNCVDHA